MVLQSPPRGPPLSSVSAGLEIIVECKLVLEVLSTHMLSACVEHQILDIKYSRPFLWPENMWYAEFLHNFEIFRNFLNF